MSKLLFVHRFLCFWFYDVLCVAVFSFLALTLSQPFCVGCSGEFIGFWSHFRINFGNKFLKRNFIEINLNLLHCLLFTAILTSDWGFVRSTEGKIQHFSTQILNENFCQANFHIWRKFLLEKGFSKEEGLRVKCMFLLNLDVIQCSYSRKSL